MAYLILPSRWARKPSGQVQLNTGNWLGQRVLAAYMAGQRAAVGRNAGTISVGAGTFASGYFSGNNGGGAAFDADGSSHLVLSRSPFSDSTSPCSVAIFVRKDAAVTYGGLFCSRPPGGSFNSFLMWSSDGNYGLTVGRSNTNSPNRFTALLQPSVGTEARVLVTMPDGPIGTANNYAAFYNQTRYASPTSATWGGPGASAEMLGYDNQNSRWNGLVDDLVVFDGVLPDAAAFDYLRAPYQIYAPLNRRIYFGVAAAGAFTLPADGGSYTLTGTAATLRKGSVLAAASGSYSLAGTAATLVRGRTLSADVGSYTVSGTAATLRFGRVLASGVGSYALSGVAATLRRGNVVTAGSGAYTLTGTDATLRLGRVLSAAAGSYSYIGTDATLTKSGAATLAAAAGSYSLSGTAATLRWGHVIAAASGSYSLNGTSATLQRGFTLAAAPGSYGLTGTAAAMLRTYVLEAATGTYSLNGTSVTLTDSGVAPVAAEPERFVGGFPVRRRRFGEYVQQPTPEEIRRERERLGILPKKSQRLVTRIAEREVDSAAADLESLRAAYAQFATGELQERAAEELRAEFARESRRFEPSAVPILEAIIAEGLRRQAETLLALEQQREEERDVRQILALWMQM